MIVRLFLAAWLLVCAGPAFAHPHVWITMKSEVLVGPDGAVTGIRHHWSFDDMFSAFALQGQASKVKGQYTREELAPLAKVNVESLKEYDYFTYATADGKKVELAPPTSDYWLDYRDSVLTLNFTLPVKTPVKAKELKVDIYDPTIFIDFEFDKKDPGKLVGGPHCKMDVVYPREMTFAEGKALSEIPADQPNVSMAWGEKFANKLLVHCP
ncbi:MAG TPA: DUF1007 family protein [Pseudolabrys sp.]|jgi:ABC-type uncharacterized transport system substrate-binding protein|uniref:DUF1007 family protein n=1 Tax=Pseudolabrys sp. TaxID=1960880 RepID=UPI002DDCEE2D|nr:DUF1007 family protein [Pseudolabrys sp.]HEV2630111.1 DUF1007 family protein [Pseudolabrys sp.]